MTYNPDAVLVVMAVDDKNTLDQANMILEYLRMTGVMDTNPVILVANKTDLVRKRVVKSAGTIMIITKCYIILISAGKHLAKSCGVKYIETSPG